MPKFKVLRGKHSEKDKNGVPRVYGPGEVVNSKSDLSRLNAPGAIKFEKVGESPASTISNAQERGRSTAPSDEEVTPSSAPSGQVSTGFQTTSGSGTTEIPIEQRAVEQVRREEAQARQATPQNQQKAPAQAQATREDKEYRAALEKMTVPELKKHADEEEIDLKGVTTKDAMIKAIVSSK